MGRLHLDLDFGLGNQPRWFLVYPFNLTFITPFSTRLAITRLPNHRPFAFDVGHPIIGPESIQTIFAFGSNILHLDCLHRFDK